MSEQLVFDLPQRGALGRDAFLVSPSNAEAVALIDALENWSAPVQWLFGPSGCGKSHLAAVLANMAPAIMLDAETLNETHVSEIIGERQSAEIIIIDRLDVLAHEEVLFHLLNFAKNGGAKILLLSQGAAGQLPFRLADLMSRLKAIPAIAMAHPDDALLRGLVHKLFDDRQLRVDTRVVDYLLPRMDRDYAAMGALIDQIDCTALAEKRAITVPLVAEVMANYV